MSSDADNYQRFGWDFESGAGERWPTEAPDRIAGVSSATEMILTGRQVSASEALALRLVNRVVASSDVLSTAIELAETIVSKRTLSIEATMVAIGQRWHPGLQGRPRRGALPIRSSALSRSPRAGARGVSGRFIRRLHKRMTSGLSLAVDAVFVAPQSRRRQVQWSPDNPLDEPLLRTLRPYLNHESRVVAGSQPLLAHNPASHGSVQSREVVGDVPFHGPDHGQARRRSHARLGTR